MFKAKIFAAILLLFLTTLVVSAREKEMPKDYQGPIAERPNNLTPGDYWEVYNRKTDKKTKWTFLRAENGQLVFQSGKRKDLLYTTPDLINVKKVHGETGEVIFKKTTLDDVAFLKFPLWTGKWWTYRYDGTSRYSISGITPIDTTCKVVAYEEITVKAGTFKAFKVEVSWRANETGDSGAWTYWYAPAAKRIIKTLDDPSGNDIELIEYKVQSSQ